jgi:PIN domain nuclease of toxin-antitoxin system
LSAWLVDTQALIWFLNGDKSLSRAARETIEAPANRILVSAASIWEMAIKVSLGKLEVPMPVLSLIEQNGFETLDVTPDHAWAVAALPVGEHKDPFDRQLAAQALVERIPIISADAGFDQYVGVRRHW